MTMADVFARIYDINYWGLSDSSSGPGSDLEQTAVIRAEIPKLIEDLKSSPCWTFHVAISSGCENAKLG